MKTQTRRYAKRQLTWLRKLPDKIEIDVTRRDAQSVAEEVRSALSGAAESSACVYGCRAWLYSSFRASDDCNSLSRPSHR